MANLDSVGEQLAKMEEASTDTTFWDDPQKAQEAMQDMKDMRSLIKEAKSLRNMLDDVDTAAELASMEVNFQGSCSCCNM